MVDVQPPPPPPPPEQYRGAGGVQTPFRFLNEVNKKLLYYANNSRHKTPKDIFSATGAATLINEPCQNFYSRLNQEHEDADHWSSQARGGGGCGVYIQTKKQSLCLARRTWTSSNYYKNIDRINWTEGGGGGVNDDTVSTYLELVSNSHALLGGGGGDTHSAKSTDQLNRCEDEAVSVCTRLSFLKQAPLASSENITLACSDDDELYERKLLTIAEKNRALNRTSSGAKRGKKLPRSQSDMNAPITSYVLNTQHANTPSSAMMRASASVSRFAGAAGKSKPPKLETSAPTSSPMKAFGNNSEQHAGLGRFFYRLRFKPHSFGNN